MLSTEQLLMPRYKVIAVNGFHYPNSPFLDGEILTEQSKGVYISVTKDGTNSFYDRHPENYPHLFKRLEWWEHRDASEMPMYVKSMADGKGDIFKIESWEMDMLIGWINKKERSVCSLTTFKPEYGYFPATLTEYQSFINGNSSNK